MRWRRAIVPDDASGGPRGRCRVAVTGASGYIGRALLARLAAEDAFQTIALTRSSTIARRCAAAGSDSIVWLSTEDPQALSDVDAVVHLAGVTADDGADALERCPDPDGSDGRTLSLNARLVHDMATRARLAGVRRFILVSSVKVHGERSFGQPLTEASALLPAGRYAQSKVESENVLARVAGDALETVVVRPVLVYGPGASGNVARLMKLARSPVPKPFAGIDNRRSVLSVQNLADLLARCIDHPKAAGGTFLAADSEALSTAQLIKALSRKQPWLVPGSAELLFRLGRLTGRAGLVERLVYSLEVDTSAARDTLGWTPPVAVRDGLAAMLASDAAR